ncbi:cysteine-rich KTR domain-containing protein [Anaerotignum lactatifermentans]|uniref:cysteine-rich KTR domain-containing protein n=1 Tax=Anaerotignum lactatifermentans TaxID=160404 RepID=UPI003AB7D4DC
MMNTHWILCPVCKSKTRLKIRTDTVLEKFPLYCPKCKQESIISVQKHILYPYDRVLD